MPEAHWNLGGLYFRKGKYKPALRHLHSALDNMPPSAGHRYQIGLVYYSLGNFKKSRKRISGSAPLSPWIREGDPRTDKGLHSTKQIENCMEICAYSS